MLKVKVVPGASSSRVAGKLGDTLKVRVAAPPEKGKANRALIGLLAGSLKIPESDITIAAGSTSHYKTVAIRGITLEAICATLGTD